MRHNEVLNYVRKTIEARGYQLEERSSIGTDSCYFTIKDGDYWLCFRVATHAGDGKLSTLRSDRRLLPKDIEAYVDARIRDLRYRKLKGVLDL